MTTTALCGQSSEKEIKTEKVTSLCLLLIPFTFSSWNSFQHLNLYFTSTYQVLQTTGFTKILHDQTGFESATKCVVGRYCYHDDSDDHITV